MPEYKRPKNRLHRDFVYLDHETVLNSLSAFEAGRVDEIILKTAESSEGGLQAGIGVGSVKFGGSGKKEAQLREELVRKRTWFSGFDGWLKQLTSQDAIGMIDGWDLSVRDQLRVGDTVQFEGAVRLSPLYLMFRTFTAYAASAGPNAPMFKATAKEAADAKATARAMQEWMTSPGGSQASSVYFTPVGSEPAAPRIVGRVADEFLTRGLGELDGVFTIIAQTQALLEGDMELSAVRVIRDTPPTPLETQVLGVAMAGLKESAGAMGVEIEEADISYRYPTVILRPIAIYR